MFLVSCLPCSISFLKSDVSFVGADYDGSIYGAHFVHFFLSFLKSHLRCGGADYNGWLYGAWANRGSEAGPDQFPQPSDHFIQIFIKIFQINQIFHPNIQNKPDISSKYSSKYSKLTNYFIHIFIKIFKIKQIFIKILHIKQIFHPNIHQYIQN